MTKVSIGKTQNIPATGQKGAEYIARGYNDSSFGIWSNEGLEASTKNGTNRQLRKYSAITCKYS